MHTGTHSPSKPSDIIELNVLERNTMGGFSLFPLLILRVHCRRQRSDAPPRRCRRLVATTTGAGASAFPHTHGTHAMGNKGCGGDNPVRTARPWQRRSCCRYGNDSRQTMFDHGESRLEIFSFCSCSCCCNFCFVASHQITLDLSTSSSEAGVRFLKSCNAVWIVL
jgi:hypothetical protein